MALPTSIGGGDKKCANGTKFLSVKADANQNEMVAKSELLWLGPAVLRPETPGQPWFYTHTACPVCLDHAPVAHGAPKHRLKH